MAEDIRELLVALMDLQDRAKQLQRDLEAWQKRFYHVYESLDAALDGENLQEIPEQ